MHFHLFGPPPLHLLPIVLTAALAFAAGMFFAVAEVAASLCRSRRQVRSALAFWRKRVLRAAMVRTDASRRVLRAISATRPLTTIAARHSKSSRTKPRSSASFSTASGGPQMPPISRHSSKRGATTSPAQKHRDELRARRGISPGTLQNLRALPGTSDFRTTLP